MVTLPNGIKHISFSKLKEYMTDEQPTVESVIAEWLLKTWLKNNTIEELRALLEDEGKADVRNAQ